MRRALGVASFALLVPATAFAIAGNGKLQIHHIDVGQGDGALLISPNGQTAFFDDGNYLDCSGIKSYLQGLGITTVDYHFLSHYHADHLGCIDDLAAIGITVGTTGYDRGYSYSSASYTSYVNTLGGKRVTVAKGQVVTLDAGSANPVTIKCVDLNGAGAYSVNGSDENAKSAVFLVSYGAFDEVIGGDLTGSVTSGNDVETTVGPETGDVEVYKVHHHGSRYSSNDNWLNAVTPEAAVISCGDGNTYGHPTVDALTRLHNHGVHTYWTETGAGATPDPSWDKVGGTIVVQADPGDGATYTVAGSGFSDSYVNGGGSPPPPPLNATQFPTSLTMLVGTLSSGDVTRLAASDDSRIGVSAAVSGGKYSTDWYGSAQLAHPPLNLTVTYEGSFTVSRTQTLYAWNWGTSAWDQVNSATVGTTDATKTWTTTAPANYVGPSNEVRFRVKGNNRNASYTCRGDFMSFNYDYLSGTAPQAIATRVDGALDAAVSAALASAAPSVFAAVASHEEHPDLETLARETPLAALKRIEAEPSPAGARLTWAVGTQEHVDGFNVYREAEDGQLRFVGNDANLETVGNEAIFRFVDASGVAAGNYWLGARSCSGPEVMIGPIAIAGRVEPAALGFSIAGNPVRGAANFELSLPVASEVRLDVFDVQGRHVATPWSGHAAVGVLKAGWNLRDASGSRVLPGLYFARVQAMGRTLYSRISVIGN